MTPVEQLCYLQGVGHSYTDFHGQLQVIDQTVREKILVACGHQLTPDYISHTNEALDALPWLALIAPFQTCTISSVAAQIRLPQGVESLSLSWRLFDQHNELSHQGTCLVGQLVETGNFIYNEKCYLQRALVLPNVAVGYYQLKLNYNGQVFIGDIAICPDKCADFASDEKMWGVTAQLYCLKSQDDYGIGDFSALVALIENSAERGADFVLLNPLHKLFKDNPENASPYSPSDRHQLNPLYISPRLCIDYIQTADLPAFDDDFIHYAQVAQRKYAIFEQMFFTFCEVEKSKNSERYQEFMRFCQQHSNWQLSDFDYYLQWVAAEQLADCQRLCLSLKMKIGLMLDLAVGCAPDGEEFVRNKALFGQAVFIGAPADDHAKHGQNWGLPPLNPLKLKATKFQFFIELLRNNMNIAGAIRIDHVMGLLRLWWCLADQQPDVGSYVYYPFNDLVNLLSLESVLNNCPVIGEDLGIVPEEVKQAMTKANIYGNNVFYFERHASGEFKAANQIRANSMLMLANHDVPPFACWWQLQDLDIKYQLGLIESDKELKQEKEERELAKKALTHWLATTEQQQVNTMYQKVMVELSRSSAKLLCVQVDDLALCQQPVNIPGTHKEYPNWRRRISKAIDEMFSETTFFEQINQGRRHG